MKVKLLKKFRKVCNYVFITSSGGGALIVTDLRGELKKRPTSTGIASIMEDLCKGLFFPKYIHKIERQNNRQLRKQLYGSYRHRK